jgi:hypothetical protein
MGPLMATTVEKLLRRGDEVSIEHGRLVIRPASGKAVPPDWYKENAPIIIGEVLATLGIEAYRYRRYKTGHFGKAKLPGVHLYFCDALSGSSAYSIFNVYLTRVRSTKLGKAGAALPDGRFRVGEQSHFYRFWRETGLPAPKSLTAFHDCMSKLRHILFVADKAANRNQRLDSDSIRPLSLSVEQLRCAFSPDNFQITSGQFPDNSQIRNPDKDSPQSHVDRGFQRNPTTCRKHYENTVISNNEDTRMVMHPTTSHGPRIQSIDEWLADYEGETA